MRPLNRLSALISSPNTLTGRLKAYPAGVLLDVSCPILFLMLNDRDFGGSENGAFFDDWTVYSHPLCSVRYAVQSFEKPPNL